MRFLDLILGADRPPRNVCGTGYPGGRSVGDGIEAADVAFYGPVVFNRPVTTWGEDA